MDTYYTRARAVLRSAWIVALAAAEPCRMRRLGRIACGIEHGARRATSDTGHAAGQPHRRRRRLRRLLRRRAVRDLATPRRRHRRGACRRSTRIDFAQLTELSDLLAVATLAPGDIVGGTIRLDYGNAEVFVESGGQVVRANVVGRQRRAARCHGDRHRARGEGALGHHSRPRRVARARLRSRRFARGRSRPVAARS